MGKGIITGAGSLALTELLFSPINDPLRFSHLTLGKYAEYRTVCVLVFVLCQYSK